MAIKKSAKEIIFTPEPFFTCIASALEVYKRETYGLLFSHNGNRIEFAYTFQSAKRKFSRVENSDKVEESIIYSTKEDFGLHLIGDFHSHTDYRYISLCELSPEDLCWLKENPNKISLIFNLFRDGEPSPLVEMRGYYYDLKQKRIKRTKIIASRRLEGILSKNNPSYLKFFESSVL